MRKNSNKFKAAALRTLKKREKQRQESVKALMAKDAIIKKIVEVRPMRTMPLHRQAPALALPAPIKQKTKVYFQLIYRSDNGIVCEFAGLYNHEDNLPKLPEYIYNNL